MKRTFIIFGLTILSNIAFGQNIAIANALMSREASKSRIILAYDDGISEVTLLKAIDIRSADKENEGYAENQAAIGKLIQQMEDKGFELTSTSHTKETYDMRIMLYFRKKK